MPFKFSTITFWISLNRINRDSAVYLKFCAHAVVINAGVLNHVGRGCLIFVFVHNTMEIYKNLNDFPSLARYENQYNIISTINQKTLRRKQTFGCVPIIFFHFLHVHFTIAFDCPAKFKTVSRNWFIV